MRLAYMIRVERGDHEWETPVGTVVAASMSLPPGWLWAEGQVFANSEHPDLYAVLGHAYGVKPPLWDRFKLWFMRKPWPEYALPDTRGSVDTDCYRSPRA